MMIDGNRLAGVLARIAQTLITDYDVSAVLYDLCDELAELVGVTAAGVMLVEDASDGTLRFAAASDERCAVLERLQTDLGEGPAVEAFLTGEPALAADLTDPSNTYGRFSGKAVAEGIHAVFAFPLQIHDRRVGTLAVHHDEPGSLDDDAVEACRTLAASAAAFIVNARALDAATTLTEQLHYALESRVVIEQAKGKLSEQLGMDVAAAFDLIRQHARNRRLRLRDVAADVVDGSLVIRLTPVEADGSPADDRPLRPV